MSTPVARGALFAVATVAVAALLVWGLFLMVRWVWPAGQALQITKPAGGTIVGPGIECGTRGSRCSTTIATGEAVELQTIPDKDYVWSGYTGDCAPTGRTSMAGPRTCGATFDHVVGPVTGAYIQADDHKTRRGNRRRGGRDPLRNQWLDLFGRYTEWGSSSLKADSDDGYTFDQFTGDCPSTGETTMTSAKSCGVVFLKSPGPSTGVQFAHRSLTTFHGYLGSRPPLP